MPTTNTSINTSTHSQQDFQKQHKMHPILETCIQDASIDTSPPPGSFKKQTTSALYPGSRFAGYQRSGRSSYDVSVELQYVNLQDSYLCGYLHITGLTDEYPTLCTFFDAEIIGPKYPFLTRKWEADDHVDRQHWTRFPSFHKYESFLNRDYSPQQSTTTQSTQQSSVMDFNSEDVIFMRWKEHFLVPNHAIKSIIGASFAGFYYICYQKSTRTITGLYYHQNSEWFQQLQLRHVPDKSFSSFEFR